MSNNMCIQFRKNLNRIMIEKEISITELSNRTGIPVRTLFTYANGSSMPSVDRVDTIAIGLGVNFFMMFLE